MLRFGAPLATLAIFAAGATLGGSVVVAQEAPETEELGQLIAEQDELIAEQESLLNAYRCLFNVDTQVVPGGCENGRPALRPTEPGGFEGTPTLLDVQVRDELVASQETLLNEYRCRFAVDAHVVPDGCSDSDLEPAPTPSPTPTPTIAPSAPGPPTNLQVTGHSSGRRCVISWSPPGSDGDSAITGYTVTVSRPRQVPFFPPWSTTRDFPASARSMVSCGRHETTYTVTVRAINAVGAGPTVTAMKTTQPQEATVHLRQAMQSGTYYDWLEITVSGFTPGAYRVQCLLNDNPYGSDHDILEIVGHGKGTNLEVCYNLMSSLRGVIFAFIPRVSVVVDGIPSNGIVPHRN